MSKWEMVRLGDICNVAAGQGAPQGDDKYCKEGTPFIKAGNLSELISGTSENQIQQVNDNVAKQHKLKLYPKDTIVFAKSGMSCMKGHVYKLKDECYIVNHLACITPKKVYASFLKYFFIKMPPNRLIKDESYPSISLNDISSIEIPLPPLDVQKHIADTLDKTQEIINSQKKQIEELDNLIKATFYDMFGDPITNDKNWQMKYLSDFYIDKSAVKCGPFGSALKKDEYVESGIPVWVMDNISKEGEFLAEPYLYITNEKLEDLKSYNVQNGDIIISRAGTVGKMCVVNSSYDKSIISTNLIRLRLNNDILPVWVVKLIRYAGNNLCRLKTGDEGAFTHMNTGVLNNIYFPYPPLELQNKFAKIVTNIEEQKAIVKQSITECQNLFNSLMSKYFD